MSELLKPAPQRRALTPEQRDELLRLIAAVPPVASEKHPAVAALIAFDYELRKSGVPWFAPTGRFYLKIGGMCSDGRTNVAVGLDLMQQLADVRDWGDAPRGFPVL